MLHTYVKCLHYVHILDMNLAFFNPFFQHSPDFEPIEDFSLTLENTKHR